MNYLVEPVLSFLRRHWKAVLLFLLLIWTLETYFAVVMVDRVRSWIKASPVVGLASLVAVRVIAPLLYPFYAVLWLWAFVTGFAAQLRSAQGVDTSILTQKDPSS